MAFYNYSSAQKYNRLCACAFAQLDCHVMAQIKQSPIYSEIVSTMQKRSIQEAFKV